MKMITDSIYTVLDEGLSITILGSPGSGKTSALSVIGKSSILKLATGLYVDAREVEDLVKWGRLEGVPTDDNLKRAYVDDIMLIDNVHTIITSSKYPHHTPFGKLCDFRYDRKLSTVLALDWKEVESSIPKKNQDQLENYKNFLAKFSNRCVVLGENEHSRARLEGKEVFNES